MSVSQEEVERVKELLRAWCDGKRLEYLGPSGVWLCLHDGETPLIYIPSHWRLKPSPTVRQWKAHEAVGKVVRQKEAVAWQVIVAATDGCLTTGRGHDWNPKVLLDCGECLLADGSIGPCGVVEGQ